MRTFTDFLSVFSVFILLSGPVFADKSGPELFASAEGYCEGDPGVTFGVHNSVNGDTYTLQAGLPWGTVEEIAGDGGTVMFNGIYEAGQYRLLEFPLNVITIQEVDPPQVFDLTVTNDGNYCADETLFPLIRLSGSEPSGSGVVYELYLGDELKATRNATGGIISFGRHGEEGTYTAIARRLGCVVDMNGEVEITMLPIPQQVFIVTGGGAYCDNRTNYPSIGLHGSEPIASGVIYKLYLDGIVVAEQPAIGVPFSFSNPDPDVTGWPEPGIYTVLAHLGDCTIEMDGEAEVIMHEAAEVSFSYTEPGPPLQCGFVEFQSLVTGGTAPFEYKWHFTENDSLMTANPEFHFPAYGIGTQMFQVTLRTTDDNGCIVSHSENITVLQRPDASLGEENHPPGVTTFAFCGATDQNPNGEFSFFNASTTQHINTSYSIDWGDSSPFFEDDTFSDPVNHIYNTLGNKNLIFTVEGLTECVGVTDYNVFVGSNPVAGFPGGESSGIAPYTYTFQITEAEFNPPGTVYKVDFGDGNDTTFVELPPNNSLIHVYTECATVPDNDGIYAFTATLRVENDCGFTRLTAGPFLVSCRAEADFTVPLGDVWGGNGLDTLVTCHEVTFDNTTIPGFFITGGGAGFTDQTNYLWDFGDGHTSNEKHPTHYYDEGNTWYTVSLTAWTSPNPNNPNSGSGPSVMTKQIFVQGTPQPDFEIGTITGTCVPIEVQLIDQSFQYDFGLQLYEWQIRPIETEDNEKVVFRDQSEIDFTIPFFEDFDSAPGDYWTFPEGTGNWSFGSSYTPPSSQSGPPNALFSWSPARVDYSYSLTSPVFEPGNISEIIYMDYMVYLDSYSESSLEQLSVEYKVVDDSDWTLLENFSNEGLGGSSEEYIRVNQQLNGITDQPFQVRFRAHGENSYNLNGWGVDDVKIHMNAQQNPVIVFEEPGLFEIRLRLTNSCGSAVSEWKEINHIFKGEPEVEILDEIMVCGCEIIDLSDEIIVYDYSMGENITYLWAIEPAGASISTPTLAYPTIIIEDDVSQKYSLLVTVTNECGEIVSEPLFVNVTQSISGNEITFNDSNEITVCYDSVLSGEIIGTISPELDGGTGDFDFEWYILEGDGTIDDWILIDDADDSSLTYTDAITVHPTRFIRRVISGCCTSDAELVVNVSSEISNNIISADQEICSGEVPSPITGLVPEGGADINGGTVTYTFTWEKLVDPFDFDSWEDADGIISSGTYTPTQLFETTLFRRRVETDVCISYSNVVQITVNQIPEIETDDMISVCSEEALDLLLDNTVDDAEYKWTVIDLSGGDVSGFNSQTDWGPGLINDVLENTSNITPGQIQYIIETRGPADTHCLGGVFTLTVTVNPSFSDDYPASLTIPTGTPVNITGNVFGGSPDYSYDWQPDNKIASGQDQANTTTTILTDDQIFTLTVLDAEGCEYVVEVEVFTTGDGISVELVSSDDQICYGGVVTLTANASGGAGTEPGDYDYEWTGIPPNADAPEEWIRVFVPESVGNNDYSVEVFDGHLV